MKLIQELIEQIPTDIDVTQVLLKAKVLAKKLKLPELSEWVAVE